MNLCEVSKCKNDREVEKALRTLPSGLDATYVRSLEQINRQEDYRRRLAFRTLRWVMYAERPLTTTELQHALAAEKMLDIEQGEELDEEPDKESNESGEELDEEPEELNQESDEELDDIDVILGACAHLLVEDNSKTVRPIHYSVQEFITSPKSHTHNGRLLNTFQDVDQIHARLAATCISHLESRLLDEGPCTEADLLDDRIQEGPFLWYAACAFDYHLVCCTSPSEDIIRSMTAFLQLPSGVLASVLQLRAVRGLPQELYPSRDFSPYDRTIDKRTVVYSTKLFDIPDLEKFWRGSGPPPNVLHQACSAGSTSAVSRLLAEEVNVDEQDDMGVTPMYYGAVSGNVSVVRMLLARQADVNVQGGHYGNALQAASAGGHELIVRLLLDKGADVNAQGGHYGSALQAASNRGHEPIVWLLLDEGADVNAQGGKYYGNALHAASEGGHELIVRLLLDKGADINAQGGRYGSALQAASEGGHEPIVQLLLDKGADVNAQGGEYGSALHVASAGGHEPIVRLLLDEGADVNAQGGHFGNALQAASNRGHEPIVRLLLDKGADVNAQGGYFGSALQAASNRGHKPIMRLLLDKGADRHPFIYS
jgi:ankyrin repeat protein